MKSLKKCRVGASTRSWALCSICLLVIPIFLGPSPASAIIGGKADPASPVPAIMILDDNGGFCSAVAITGRDILTAAHCVKNSGNYRVYFNDLNNAPVLIEPIKIVTHPQYDPNAIKNRTRSIDLAIVSVKDPLPNHIKLASIATRSPQSNDTVTVMGFGRRIEKDMKSVGKLYSINLDVIEPYGRSKILVWLSGAKIKKIAGACHGDSGGPQFLEDTLVAITTWTTGEGHLECGDLTQGALVFPQIEWIKGTVGNPEELKLR